MKLTITRSKWLRGTVYSYLLRSADQKMCCLGFYILACGNTPEDITDMTVPSDVDNWKGADIDTYNIIYNTLADINDDLDRTEDSREQIITDHFRTIGVEVEFVD